MTRPHRTVDTSVTSAGKKPNSDGRRAGATNIEKFRSQRTFSGTRPAIMRDQKVANARYALDMVAIAMHRLSASDGDEETLV